VKREPDSLAAVSKLHVAEGFADFEVLLRCVVPARLLAGMRVTTLSFSSLPTGHRHGDVRDARQGVVQLFGKRAIIFFG
jgi:hypothetical protein